GGLRFQATPQRKARRETAPPPPRHQRANGDPQADQRQRRLPAENVRDEGFHTPPESPAFNLGRNRRGGHERRRWLLNSGGLGAVVGRSPRRIRLLNLRRRIEFGLDLPGRCRSLRLAAFSLIRLGVESRESAVERKRI